MRLGFPALFAESMAAISPTMTAVLIIPLAFASAGRGHLAGLRLRHRDAALRRLLPEPVRQAIGLGGLDVRLYRPGPRPDRRRALGLDADLVATSSSASPACAVSPSSAGSCSKRSAITARSIRSSSSRSARCCAGSIAYKDIRVSSILTLVLEGLSVTCILSLAGIVLFKHGFHVDTAQTVAQGVEPARHGSGRRGLHLQPGRLRERHRARW